MTNVDKKNINSGAPDSDKVSKTIQPITSEKLTLEDKDGPSPSLKADAPDFVDSDVQETTSPLPLSDQSYVKSGWLAIIIVFGVFGIWAATAPLNSAAVAPGKVIVEQNNRVVDHLEGGIVADILVKEGDKVDASQTLIKLSGTQIESELFSVKSRLNHLLTLESRLKAERQGLSRIIFPVELTLQESDPILQELMDGQSDLFLSRKASFEQELNIYRQKISALEEQATGLSGVIDSLTERIASYRVEVSDWEELYKQQFAEKTRLIEVQRELSRLVGEKSNNQAEKARIIIQIGEAQSQLALHKKSFIQDVVSELRSIQSEKIDLQSRIVALSDRLNRLDIRSPANGIVKGLNVFTIGGVARPGEPLMEIIPLSDKYKVLARLAVTDIDKVVSGLIADVRFSAFNTQTTHVVEGEVVTVSADSFEDPSSGERYFEVSVLVTSDGSVQMEKDGVFLLPGMPAEVIIKTGERTLLGYILKPLENMFVRSFNED